LGLAFAFGYQAALHALDSTLPRDAIASLCATEAAGAHPRAIATELVVQDGTATLNGEKRWSTMSLWADVLLVVARAGVSADGRPQLRLIRVPRATGGVVLADAPPPPFAPEIAHGVVTLTNVRVPESAMLDGDGYERYLKPFRTVEDLHVQAAAIAYATATAIRSDSERGVVEPLLACLAAIRTLAGLDSSAPSTHLALAGVIDSTAAALVRAESMWARVSMEERERWHRDRPLLGVAGGARARRLERAWERIGRAAT
jgi:hypothetical protein